MEKMRAVNPKNHKNLIKTTLKWRVLANLELYRKVRVGSDKVFIKFHKNRQILDRTKMSIYSTITIVNFYTKKLFNCGTKVNKSLYLKFNRLLSQQNVKKIKFDNAFAPWLFGADMLQKLLNMGNSAMQMVGRGALYGLW